MTDADDQLLAVGISMPSLAEALQKAHGRLLPMGWYHLAKTIFLKMCIRDRPRTGFLHCIGQQKDTGTAHD